MNESIGLLPIIMVALGLLVMMVISGKGKIEDANEQIKAEMGERYNPDMAGRPWRDSIVIMVIVMVALVIVVGAIGSYLPEP